MLVCVHVVRALRAGGRAASACHQHHQTPAPANDQHNNCDHQKAVSAPSADVAMAHLGVVAAPVFLPELMAAAPLAPAMHLVLESPPGLVTPSVLRI